MVRLLLEDLSPSSQVQHHTSQQLDKEALTLTPEAHKIKAMAEPPRSWDEVLKEHAELVEEFKRVSRPEDPVKVLEDRRARIEEGIIRRKPILDEKAAMLRDMKDQLMEVIPQDMTTAAKIFEVCISGKAQYDTHAIDLRNLTAELAAVLKDLEHYNRKRSELPEQPLAPNGASSSSDTNRPAKVTAPQSVIPTANSVIPPVQAAAPSAPKIAASSPAKAAASSHAKIAVSPPAKLAAPPPTNIAAPSLPKVAAPCPAKIAAPSPAKVAVSPSAMVATLPLTNITAPSLPSVAAPSHTKVAVSSPAKLAVSSSPAKVAVSSSPAEVTGPSPAKTDHAASEQTTSARKENGLVGDACLIIFFFCFLYIIFLALKILLLFIWHLIYPDS
ncbi:hypothetical protein K402DRAFT_451995 [Aulographum hederae CBS 113979]|uniref:Uncharacterized protein n=1 Tax=Aulographum hederae CBS 113979 TaxID=1176131 RepID=A0A6G1H9J9_9PEZI|nr:hypothetical protein K402DRAFT_451995 [Aulographum hederae CBS 113979]